MLLSDRFKDELLNLHKISCSKDTVAFSIVGNPATARMSLSFNNTREYIESAKLSAFVSPNGNARPGPSKWAALRLDEGVEAAP